MSTASREILEPVWDRLQRQALAVALVGFVVWLLGYFFSPTEQFASYLVAWVFWGGIGLGCLALLMVQYLTGGTWGVAARRIFESGAVTLLPLAVLFLPLALGMGYLYPWANPATFQPAPGDEAAHHLATVLRHKAAYLNVTAYWARTSIYFIIWLSLVFLLVRQERETPAINSWRQRLSAIGLVIYALTITFASVDWTMSLEPEWYSTIYPVLFGVSQLLSAFAVAVAVLMLLAERPPVAEIFTPKLYRDLGSLLFTFIMLWAYMSISQLLLIWSGNIKEEIPWYLRRSRDGWQWVAALLAAFNFTLPFFLLLFRRIKQNPRAMLLIACLILVTRALDIVWWIEPAFSREGFMPFWLLDVAALAALGGLWLFLFLRQLRRQPLLAVPVEEGGAHG